MSQLTVQLIILLVFILSWAGIITIGVLLAKHFLRKQKSNLH